MVRQSPLIKTGGLRTKRWAKGTLGYSGTAVVHFARLLETKSARRFSTGSPDREVKANPSPAELNTHVKRAITKRMQVRIFRYFFDMFNNLTLTNFLLSRF